MRILVIGATGFIGRKLSHDLLLAGHQVIGVTRNPEAAASILGPGIEIRSWDGKSVEGLKEALSDADGVVNLAGASIASWLWTKSRKQKLKESRIGTGHALTDAILRMPVRPGFLIQGSACGYYGSMVEQPADETGMQGPGFLADLTRKWEDSVALLEDTGMRVVYLRTGIVLGKGGGMLGKLMLPFSFYAGTTLGSGNQWLSWIHLKDLSDAIIFLIRNNNSSGMYNLSSPNPVRMQEMISTISKLTGKPAWVKIPSFILKVVLGKMASETVLASQRIIPARLAEEGFRFNYPEIEPALADIISGPGR